MQSHFVLLATDSKGRNATLPVMITPLLIGSAHTNVLIFDSPNVVPLAAVLHAQENGALWVEPRSHVLLNGLGIVQPVALNEGDVLTIGDAKIRVQKTSTSVDVKNIALSNNSHQPPANEDVVHYHLRELACVAIACLCASAAPFAIGFLQPWLPSWVCVGSIPVVLLLAYLLFGRAFIPSDGETPYWTARLMMGLLSLAVVLGFVVKKNSYARVTLHNPSEQAATFSFSRGGPSLEIGAGSWATLDVRMGDYSIKVRNSSGRVESVSASVAWGKSAYLVSAFRSGCYVRQELEYSRTISITRYVRTDPVLEILEGQGWYNVDAHFVLDEPPSRISVKGGHGKTKRIWFRYVPCEILRASEPTPE